jgi:hypothetical protein
MAASTRRYFGFDFYLCNLQMKVAAAIVETPFLFANKLDLKPQDKTITFAGDGQEKLVYLTTAIVAEFSQDTIDVRALSNAFLKTEVTAGLVAGDAALTWFGDLVEAGGAVAGLSAYAHAIKDVGGVQSAVNIRLWLPVTTLTNAKPTGFTTSAKADTPMIRLSANRTSVDLLGAALPGVPTGGATYAIVELT